MLIEGSLEVNLFEVIVAVIIVSMPPINEWREVEAYSFRPTFSAIPMSSDFRWPCSHVVAADIVL